MVLTQVASSTQWRVHIFMDCTAFPPANLHMTWDLPDRILFRICPLEVRNSSPFPLLIACLCATKLGWQIQIIQCLIHPPVQTDNRRENRPNTTPIWN